jgi:hypothetical protein
LSKMVAIRFKPDPRALSRSLCYVLCMGATWVHPVYAQPQTGMSAEATWKKLFMSSY